MRALAARAGGFRARLGLSVLFAAKSSCAAFWTVLGVLWAAPPAQASALGAMFGWMGIRDTYGMSIWGYLNALPSGHSLSLLSFGDGLVKGAVAAEIAFMVFCVAVILWLFGIFLSPFWAALFSSVFTIVGATISQTVLNERIGYWAAFVSFGTGLVLMFSRQASRGRQLALVGVLIGGAAVPLAVSQAPSQLTPNNAVVAFENAGGDTAGDLMDRGNKAIGADEPKTPAPGEKKEADPQAWLDKENWVVRLQAHVATETLRHSVQILVYGKVLDDINGGKCALAWNEGLQSKEALFSKTLAQVSPAADINPVTVTLRNKLDQFCGADVVAEGENSDFTQIIAGIILAWLLWRLVRPIGGAGISVGQSAYNFYADMSVSPLVVAGGAAPGSPRRFLKIFGLGILGALFYVYIFILVLGLYSLILSVGVSNSLAAHFPPAQYPVVKIAISAVLAHYTTVWLAAKAEQFRRASAEGHAAHESGRRARERTSALAGAAGGLAGGALAAYALPARNPALTSRIMRAMNAPLTGGGAGAGKNQAATQSALAAAGPWGRAAALGLGLKGMLDRQKDRAKNLDSGARAWGGSSPRPAGAPERAPKPASKDTPEQQYNSSIGRGGVSPATKTAPSKGNQATKERTQAWREAARKQRPARKWEGNKVGGYIVNNPKDLDQMRAAYDKWAENTPEVAELESKDTSKMSDAERQEHQKAIDKLHSKFQDWMSK